MYEMVGWTSLYSVSNPSLLRSTSAEACKLEDKSNNLATRTHQASGYTVTITTKKIWYGFPIIKLMISISRNTKFSRTDWMQCNVQCGWTSYYEKEELEHLLAR